MIICGLIGEKRVSAAWEAKQVSAYSGRFVMFSLLVSHVDVVATGHLLPWLLHFHRFGCLLRLWAFSSSVFSLSSWGKHVAFCSIVFVHFYLWPCLMRALEPDIQVCSPSVLLDGTVSLALSTYCGVILRASVCVSGYDKKMSGKRSALLHNPRKEVQMQAFFGYVAF